MKYLFLILFSVCLSHSTISKDEVSMNRSSLLIMFFQFNTTNYRDSLAAESYKSQHSIVKELMDANPEVVLGINGYQNTEEHTNISVERAEKVKNELVKVGVPKDRMIIKKRTFDSNKQIYS